MFAKLITDADNKRNQIERICEARGILITRGNLAKADVAQSRHSIRRNFSSLFPHLVARYSTYENARSFFQWRHVAAAKVFSIEWCHTAILLRYICVTFI